MSDKACARTERLIGRAGMVRLAGAHVLVAGLGGVGGQTAETLARAGVGSLTLIDGDCVTRSNLNRQVAALHSTLGRPKSAVMAERIADINPELLVQARCEWLTPASLPALLAAGPYDYVADCIDGVAAKVALIAACATREMPIIASMGAAGRLDPSRVRLAKLNQTHGDGLARAVRRGLKARGLRPELSVVFSDEPVRPTTHEAGAGQAAHGVISYLPALFGLMLGGEIIRRLLARETG